MPINLASLLCNFPKINTGMGEVSTELMKGGDCSLMQLSGGKRERERETTQLLACG